MWRLGMTIIACSIAGYRWVLNDYRKKA